MLKGLLIDPYKMRVDEIEIEHDLASWYTALRCESVEVVSLSTIVERERTIDVWFDEEGFCQEPAPPTFRLMAGESEGGHRYILPGYGLVLASDGEGSTISLPRGLTRSLFARYSQLAFESWQDRLAPEACISEVLRSIELELPGRFKYLSQPE